MFRNYLSAALRHLAHNRVYSTISISALAIGLCATLLSALVIRNQLSYNHFIRGYERTYLAGAVLVPPGGTPLYDRMAPAWVAAPLKLTFHEIEGVARIVDQDVRVRHDQLELTEHIYWADRNTFDVLSLPVIAGNLNEALQRPDSIVLTRSSARRYFGRDAPVGETLLLNNAHVMTVTAVIDDLPVNGTDLDTGIFASGVSSYSPLTEQDNSGTRPFSLRGRTYLRVKRGASIDSVRLAIPAFVKANYPALPPGLAASLNLMRIDRVHLFPGLNPGIGSRLAGIAVIGVLILVIACVVFVNLATARTAQRALEVGVRKVSGANRSSLITQFLGEAILYVTLAVLIAAALTECLISPVNTFLNSGAIFDYWRDPRLLAWIAVGVVTVGILSGAYPALVLSAFRPAHVLRGSLFRSHGAFARECLVALQFAVLIGLLIAAAVVYRQRVYATREALRINADQILIIRSPCNSVFVKELRGLPGVRDAFCSSEAMLTRASFFPFHLRDGSVESIDLVGAEFGVLSLYGLAPLAGRLGLTPSGIDHSPIPLGLYVINETAARRFGFKSPDAAIGQALPLAESERSPFFPAQRNEIIGVVPDVAIDAVDQRPKPAIYYVPSSSYADPGLRNQQIINVKLTERDISETLAAVDRLWSATGATDPIDRFFLQDYIQNIHLGMLREAQGFGAFSAVAVLLACLGLIGLSAAATEQRTKEIGIRKAMGAHTMDILGLLIWQFVKPVLWANVIAWPIAGLLMRRWLDGFSQHVQLTPWLFLASGITSLMIAMLAVGAQCFLVARAKPISALRYE